MLTFAPCSGPVLFLELIALFRYYAFDKTFCSSSELSYGRQKSDFTTVWVIFPLLNSPVKVIHTATRWTRAALCPPSISTSLTSAELSLKMFVATCKFLCNSWQETAVRKAPQTLFRTDVNFSVEKLKICVRSLKFDFQIAGGSRRLMLLPLEAFTSFSWICCGWGLLRWVCIITESRGGWRWVPLCDKTR